MDCREQQTADSFKEFHAVPFRPQFLIITVFYESAAVFDELL